MSTQSQPDLADRTPAASYSAVFELAPSESSSRYNRQLLIPSISLSGQQRINRARVLIVGLGGLGSPAALYLAGAGVGVLGLLDDDAVELSNLHRQIVHRESSVREGMSKVCSAVRGCRDLNSDPATQVLGHEMRLGGGGASDVDVLAVLRGYDIVLDCTDNPATRYLISDACVVLGKTLVSGAAQRLEGQMMVLNYAMTETGTERGPCYRCVFPIPPAPDMVRSCGEIGILGPVVGTVGTLMASETLRLIVKDELEYDRKPSMLLYNAWSADPRSMFKSIALRGKRHDCVACGDNEVLAQKGLTKIQDADIRDGRMDYVAFCGLLEDVKLLKGEQRVTASQFLAQSEERTIRSTTQVIDVREPYEVILGPKIPASVNIPLSKVIRNNSLTNGLSVPAVQTSQPDLNEILSDPDIKSVLFVCPRGNDSQIAAHKVLERVNRQTKTVSNKFIGDIIGGFEALERAYRATPNP